MEFDEIFWQAFEELQHDFKRDPTYEEVDSYLNEKFSFSESILVPIRQQIAFKNHS